MSRNRRHRRIHRRELKKLGVLFVMVGAIAIVSGLGITLWENNRYRSDGGESDVVVTTAMDRKVVQYENQFYIQKRNIDTYLLMGIDENDTVHRITDVADQGGRADVQMLLIVNNHDKTWQLLEFDRDTLVDIDAVDADGNDLGRIYEQLALSHIYGDGMESSCKNSVKTVSRLLWDQKIDGYYALNMGGIATMNDLVGGVEVTITTDFTEVDDSLPLGETITLNGQQAYNFIHERKLVDDGFNESRMGRQEAYLKSFLKKLNSLPESDILNSYESLSSYAVSNMGSGTIADLAKKMQDYKELDMIKLEGTHQIEHEYMTFRLDEDSLAKTIIQLFYEREEQ